jgi:hypothetical protein
LIDVLHFLCCPHCCPTGVGKRQVFSCGFGAQVCGVRGQAGRWGLREGHSVGRSALHFCTRVWRGMGQVDKVGGASSAFTLSLSAFGVAAPANDAFASKATAGVNVGIAGTAVGATTQVLLLQLLHQLRFGMCTDPRIGPSAVPSPHMACACCLHEQANEPGLVVGGAPVRSTVWYIVTATKAGTLTVSTAGRQVQWLQLTFGEGGAALVVMHCVCVWGGCRMCVWLWGLGCSVWGWGWGWGLGVGGQYVSGWGVCSTWVGGHCKCKQPPPPLSRRPQVRPRHACARWRGRAEKSRCYVSCLRLPVATSVPCLSQLFQHRPQRVQHCKHRGGSGSSGQQRQLLPCPCH